MHRNIHLFATVLATAGLLLALPASAEPTLDLVRKRGELICGVNGLLPGFSAPNAAKQWEGLDVDYCRAIAAGVLGDATKVRYVPLSAEKRFNSLEDGEIDVLVRNSTYSLERSAGRKVRFATVNFYDGQAFVIPKQRPIDRAVQLAGQTVCVTKGTDHEANLTAWAAFEGISIKLLTVPTQDEMYEAFYANKCLAITQDATALASTIVRANRAFLFKMLPDIISKEPLGPYVRSGDDAWLDIVRWTHYALVMGEELGIRSDTVENLRKTGQGGQLKRLLGTTPGAGRALGLDDAWAFNMLKQVGNYGEIFARNVGMGSPLKFSRGINGLGKDCGLMYAPPI
jgi:general L-amino acid transport system substrate-binding protein